MDTDIMDFSETRWGDNIILNKSDCLVLLSFFLKEITDIFKNL